MYSSEYFLASVNYTNQRCDEFFDKLSRFQQDSSFGDKVIASAISAGTPLMAAYRVGETAIAATAAGAAFAQNVNKFTAEIYAFSSYSSQLKRHVRDQMSQYLKDVQTDWKDGRLQQGACSVVGQCFNELERMIVVRGRAQAYANICSIMNMRAIIESSLSNTQSSCTLAASDTTTAGAGALAGGVTNCESTGK